MKQPDVVLIAGSRALPPGEAPRLLIRFLANLSQDQPEATVLLRRGLFRSPNLFEAQVESLCDLVGLKVEWCYPDQKDPFIDLKGRQLTFARDVDMVDRADLILVFVTVEQVGDETSGTYALVEKALQANKTIYAYAVDGDRIVSRAGEHDPGDIWESRVPAPA